VVSWALFMQEIGLLINLQQFKMKVIEIDSSKTNTFFKKGTKYLLLVLIQEETS
jgi:hypothetical protein